MKTLVYLLTQSGVFKGRIHKNSSSLMNTETLSGATSVSAEAEVIIEDMGSTISPSPPIIEKGSKISPSPPVIGEGSSVSPSNPSFIPVSSFTVEEMDVSSIS